jgi:hypothetical protein
MRETEKSIYGRYEQTVQCAAGSLVERFLFVADVLLPSVGEGFDLH